MMGTCRSCGSERLEVVLSLGDMPLANALLTHEQLGECEATYPLDLAFCHDCTLVQITETVPPEVLFTDYPYLSSFSDTVVNNGRENAELMMETRDLGPESLVMEIGSNDGYLLQWYAAERIPVLGIDPALNVAAAAEDVRGIPTLCVFFGIDTARHLRSEGHMADVIHANNVFAHVADLNGLVAGMRTVLKDDGVIVIQVPYVRDLIEHVEFDTIYHEHLCYFSVTAACRLFNRHGMELYDVEHLPIHGGTLRLFVRKWVDVLPVTSVVRAWQVREQSVGMHSVGFYRDFAAKVKRLRSGLLTILRAAKATGSHVVGYAASAKGSTLLNYCGIGAETLDYVADRSTVKQGRYTPGTHLLIEPPEKLLETQPDFALLLAWNHAAEIMGREAEYIKRGGRFIVPVPEPRICTPEP